MTRPSRAICTAFHRYHPHVAEYYKVQFDYYVESMKHCLGEVDKIYLVDSYFNFTKDDISKLENIGFDVEVIPKEKDGHHWVQFKTALPHLKEDHILFLDNDVVITRKGVVNGWFEAAEKGTDLVTAFDGSGGLKNIVQEYFPPLKLLGDFTRMGSYYFVVDQDIIELMKKTELAPINPYPKDTVIGELGFYKTRPDDWSDSFGYLTIKIFGAGKRVAYIEDDRSSIYLMDDDNLSLEPTVPASLGYYHIRNGNHPIYLLNCNTLEDKADRDNWIKITPRRELLRILMWFDYMQENLGNKYREDIDTLLYLPSIHVTKEMWDNYKTRFKEFHELP